MKLHFRNLTVGDYPVLREMFYLSLFVPDGEEPHPETVIDLPELAKYIDGIGREGDFGFLCLDDTIAIGAIWGRIFDEHNRGYGFVDEQTPELGMAVIPEYRNRGIGQRLLTLFLQDAKERGHRAVSLSVDKRNRAKNLYNRAGFVIVKETEVDYVMMRKL